MGYFDNTQFDSIFDMADAIETVVNRNMRELMTEVRADALGLDIRAGHRLFVNEDCIAVSNNDRRTLDYYGGFEYVDSDYIRVIGDYTFYFADDDRVRGHIETYYEKEEV